jgi:hypothetical protein
MPYASEWLVELTAHDGTGPVTLRYSTSGYVTGPTDEPSDTVYDGRIGSIGAFTRHLFGEGRTMGDMSYDAAQLVLANADGGLDYILSYGFDGRPFVIKRLASPLAPYSSAETVLVGAIEGVDTSNGTEQIVVRFYDRRRDIDVSIQKNTYGGTSTSAGASADGTPDMKGQVKPLCYGSSLSVPAILVNSYNLILQFHDSALQAITLYDGGVPLINDGDVATLDDLSAATGNPGHYVTCLALGLAKPFGAFNGRPAFTWTADIIEGATAADRCAGAVVQRILAKIGLTGSDNIDAATFTALNAAQPAEVGIYIADDKSALSACKDVLDSIGGYIVPNEQGQITVGRIGEPGAVIATVTDPEILTTGPDDTIEFSNNPDTDGDVPARKVTLNWRKNWHVHTDSDLGSCVNFGSPERASILKQEFQTVFVETAQPKHLLAPELIIDTLLVDADAAQAECDRRSGMYSVDRVVTTIAVEMSEAGAMVPGATIAIEIPRYGYSGGKAMVIIGRSNDHAAERVALTVWG